MKLSNAKWERFCLEYAKTANASEAYRIVYNSKSSAQVLSQSASRLLKNEKIQARLAELHEEMASEKIANAAEVQERLTRILRLEQMEDVVVVEGIEKGVSEARIIEKDVSIRDRNKAAELLAKRYGILSESLDVNIAVPVFGGEDDLED